MLKAALSLAKKNDLWSGDPDAVIPELDDDYEPRKRSMTSWELIALASSLPPKRAAHVMWIVATGARWSESLRALWGDRFGNMQPLRGTKTKAASRTVPLLPLAVQMVNWAEERASALVEGATMFLPWGNVRRDIAIACSALGIEPVTPNDLRRTFATWLRNAGVEPQLIGAAMGHTSSRMVERVYGRLAPDALAKLLEDRTGAVRYACGPGDVRPLLAAPPARPTFAKAAIIGAQGRNRTADTGIFSPSVEESQVSISDTEYAHVKKTRAVGVLCGTVRKALPSACWALLSAAARAGRTVEVVA